jgi:hypothetical protein
MLEKEKKYWYNVLNRKVGRETQLPRSGENLVIQRIAVNSPKLGRLFFMGIIQNDKNQLDNSDNQS